MLHQQNGLVFVCIAMCYLHILLCVSNVDANRDLFDGTMLICANVRFDLLYEFVTLPFVSYVFLLLLMILITHFVSFVGCLISWRECFFVRAGLMSVSIYCQSRFGFSNYHDIVVDI